MNNLIAYNRRVIGIAAVRANAYNLIRRVGIAVAGAGSGQANKRRDKARAQWHRDGEYRKGMEGYARARGWDPGRRWN